MPLIVLLIISVTFIILGKINFAPINYLKVGINEIVYRVSFVASVPEKYIGYSFRAIEKHLNIYKNYHLKEKHVYSKNSHWWI